MTKRAALRCLLPLLETYAQIIKRDAIDMEAFTVASIYSDKLRSEVQDLPQLHFTSAQFLLCSFALSEIDHSTHDLKELARSVEDYMAYAMNVPEPFVRVNDSVVQFEIHLVADGFLDYIPATALIVRINPLHDSFKWRWVSSLRFKP
jgi:hypothetical protein